MVGDIVTEVNGHDCRKGVGISQIMELKSLIQQTPSDHDDASVDVSVPKLPRANVGMQDQWT